jgi:hypothetical protein
MKNLLRLAPFALLVLLVAAPAAAEEGGSFVTIEIPEQGKMVLSVAEDRPVSAVLPRYDGGRWVVTARQRGEVVEVEMARVPAHLDRRHHSKELLVLAAEEVGSYQLGTGEEVPVPMDGAAPLRIARTVAPAKPGTGPAPKGCCECDGIWCCPEPGKCLGCSDCGTCCAVTP